MNIWDIGNTKSYGNNIPPEIVEGYEVESGIFTTFGLEMCVLNNLIVNLDCLGIVKNLEVFYDIKSYEDNSDTLIPEENLHGVNLDKKAFHPKVILLRYKKNENNKNEYKEDIKYVLMVLSKNITSSNSLETYFLGYSSSKCTENNGNGKEIANFVEYLKGRCSFQTKKKLYTKYIDELKNLTFKTDDSKISNINFLTEKEVFSEIQNMNNVTVVSPFINKEIVDDSKFEKVISSLSSYDESFVPKNEEKNKYYYFSEEISGESSFSLHAKIYCGKSNDGNSTELIIGSSNATFNGLCWVKSEETSVTNSEFNVKLSFNDNFKMYTEFNSAFDEYIQKISSESVNENDIETDKEKEKAKKKLTYTFAKLYKDITIKVEKAEKTKGFKLSVTVKNYEKYKDYELKFSIKRPNGNVDELELRKEDELYELELRKVEPILSLTLNKKNSDVKEEFDIRILDCLDKTCDQKCVQDYLNILEEDRKKNYDEILKASINQLTKNTRKAKFNIEPRQKGDGTSRQNTRVNKTYVFEQLKAIAIELKVRDFSGDVNEVNFKENYISKLNDIKKIADLAENDEYLKELKLAIEELLKYEVINE